MVIVSSTLKDGGVIVVLPNKEGRVPARSHTGTSKPFLSKRGGTWGALGVRLPAVFPSSPDRCSNTLRIEVGEKRRLPLRGWDSFSPDIIDPDVCPIRIFCLDRSWGWELAFGLWCLFAIFLRPASFC